MRRAARLLSWALLSGCAAATAAEPDSNPATPLSLTTAQQQAVGVRSERPLPLGSAVEIEAFGTVLDPLALLTDVGRLESTQAAAAAALADAARLEQLYRDDERASLKAVQAARAQSIEARSQARAAQLGFRLQWGPLASCSEDERRALLAALATGARLLVRAAVPGYRLGAVVGPRALLDVDGVNVVARVLGPLPRVDPQLQSAAWLLEVQHGPQGLGPGVRATVHLQTTPAAGLLVPAAALVYSPDGAFVYRESRAPAPGSLQYALVPVRPLARVGAAWLVAGLTRADQIVVQGAGVLWSMQGIGGFSAAEEDHD
ncbi:MAG TPA: hypothetical protein VNX02_02740 [Steroidobacteraceae bacterium]|jgi:hypothetical protein|nr:hypothetical protein [Steroidobacteraceae bacterium]